MVPRDSFSSKIGWLVVLSLLAVYVVWGSTYLAIRVALEGFPGAQVKSNLMPPYIHLVNITRRGALPHRHDSGRG